MVTSTTPPLHKSNNNLSPLPLNTTASTTLHFFPLSPARRPVWNKWNPDIFSKKKEVRENSTSHFNFTHTPPSPPPQRYSSPLPPIWHPSRVHSNKMVDSLKRSFQHIHAQATGKARTQPVLKNVAEQQHLRTVPVLKNVAEQQRLRAYLTDDDEFGVSSFSLRKRIRDAQTFVTKEQSHLRKATSPNSWMKNSNVNVKTKQKKNQFRTIADEDLGGTSELFFDCKEALANEVNPMVSRVRLLQMQLDTKMCHRRDRRDSPFPGE